MASKKKTKPKKISKTKATKARKKTARQAKTKKRARPTAKASKKKHHRPNFGFTVNTKREAEEIISKANRLAGGNVSDLARHAIAAFKRPIRSKA